MLFQVRGGVKLSYRKELSSESPIVQMPTPKRVCVPLQQHVGSPAEAVVEVGQWVGKGQLIGRGGRGISANVHASTSGTVIAIEERMAPHPSGLTQPTVVIEADGHDRWAELISPITADFPLPVTPKEISERVAAAGIVGLGGAAFPSAVKLDMRYKHSIDTLVINGAECEPYITCDDRLMREAAHEIVDGVRIMAYALAVEHIIIAIEGNKAKALKSMREAAKADSSICVVTVPTRFPMGSAQHLLLAVTGRETPADKRTAEVGAVVHNVATARAVSSAIRRGEPLISRVVTVSGYGVREPANVEVLLGTSVEDLLTFCGGLHPVPTLIGLYGMQRMEQLGQDDQLAWLLMPILGLMLVQAMICGIVYGLTSDEKWAVQQAQAERPSGWMAIIGVIACVLIGGTCLMTTIAFSAQRYFESQAIVD